MERENLIEEEVNKTLNALDEFTAPAANPFLFERIEASIKHENEYRHIVKAARILKPVALALIIIINIITAIAFFTVKENGTLKEQLIYSLKNDYDSNQIDY